MDYASKLRLQKDTMISFKFVAIAVGLFSLVVCAQEVDEGVVGEEQGRSLSDGYAAPDEWRAVDYKQADAPAWSQDDDDASQHEEQIPKRRRIRKRKRRPQPYIPVEASSDEEEPERLPVRPRPRRPQTLEQNNEPWKEMEEEGEQYRPRNNNRRRTGPVYDTEEMHSEETSQAEGERGRPETPVVYEKVRDPYTALEETQTKRNHQPETTTTVTAKVPDLKTLLKQTGGSLSLSEILQQRNLSLTDLLKGEQQAIHALTDIPVTSGRTTDVDAKTNSRYGTNGYRRLPPSVKRKHNFDDLFTTTTEKSAFREQLDAQRKRLAGLHIPNKKGKPFSDVTKLEVVTEATTERRVFIPMLPSIPHYYSDSAMAEKKVPETTTQQSTDVEYANYPTTIDITTTTPTPVPSTTPNRISLKPKLRLPVTSAKLNTKKPTVIVQTETENYPKPFTIPSKAFKISLNELFSSGEAAKENETTDNENVPTTTKKYTKENGPFKISLDIDQLVRKITTERMEIQSQRYKTQNVLLSKLPAVLEAPLKKAEAINTNKLEDKVMPEKLKFVTAKEELMEILRDRESRQNLTRLLESRNMTVAELVAQRERGSSQLHLADIFHNETKEPEPKDVPLIVGQIRNDIALRAFPSFDRKPKQKAFPLSVDVRTDSHGSNYYTSVVNLHPRSPSFDSEYSETIHHLMKKDHPRDITVTSFPTYKIAVDKKINDDKPSSDPVHPVPIWKTLYPALYENHYPQHPTLEIKQLLKENDLTRNDVELDEIESKIAEAVNEHLNFDDPENENDEYYQLPYGVRSAIIASSVIVGVSLFIFLTIFVIFKWSQKQRKRLCYDSSYSGSKIRSPILETGYSKRNISTIMNATLGRKKTFGRFEKQSMSDYLWENDKKPFQ